MKPPTRAVAAVLALTVGCVLPIATASPGGAARATPAGAPPSSLVLEPVASLESPIAMTTRTGTDDLFVAERPGRVRVLHVVAGVVTVDPVPLLNIENRINSGGEGGLLGLTFNPDGTRLYVHYTNVNGNTRLAEYTMANAGTGDTVDLSTRRTVLKVVQPFSNHNGGDITFGPDGRLYMALGDGGSGGDPFGNGQNRRVLLGKILRINPLAAGSRPYRVPAGNPFVGQSPRRGEIWLYGVRNPWRISFDSATGDLYVADVGQGDWEEVDFLPADGGGINAGRGVNLGWNRMEGTHPYNGATEPANHTPPVFEYDHSNGCSIIGGYVYRDTAIPALVGTYVYGDFCTGTIGGIVVDGGAVTTETPDLGISVPDFALQSFGQGNDGELYVLDGNGAVSRIEPAAP